MFCQIRVLLAFVQICTHHICCTINKALQLKNNFLQLRCVFCHRVFFLKKTSRQICTYSSIYVRSTAEIAVGQKIYLYAGLCRNVLSIRIICGSFGNVDSFERTRRESEEEQGITETLTQQVVKNKKQHNRFVKLQKLLPLHRKNSFPKKTSFEFELCEFELVLRPGHLNLFVKIQ